MSLNGLSRVTVLPTTEITVAISSIIVPVNMTAGVLTLVITGEPAVTSPVKIPPPTGSTGPRTAVATAPLPLSQASLIIILGTEVYPPPGAMISIPKTVPTALIIAFALDPLPPPPANSTVGGTLSLGTTLQPQTEVPN